MRIRRVRAPLATLAAALTFACAPLAGLSVCFGEDGHVAIEFPAPDDGTAGSCGAGRCADACGPCHDARGPSDPGVRLERPVDPAAFASHLAGPPPFAVRTPDPVRDRDDAPGAFLDAGPRDVHPQRATILLI